MAYVYITIPSISDLFIQFRLNLQAAEIAFTCRCLGQGEANVKAAIQLIEKIGENSNVNI